MTVKLKGSITTEDPRLDRLVQFDERSRSFPIREALPDTRKPRSYTWRCRPVLDQGFSGGCVGFSVAAELAARPVENPDVTDSTGRQLYWEAQQLDPWPGGAYPGANPRYEGTSVLAGVKAAQARGYFRTYRWAFSLNELLLGLSRHGPAVLGLNWYSGMFDVDGQGFIKPTGYLAGGHAILARGVNVTDRTVTLRNSWSRSWGRGGDCRISWADLERLLHEQGEAVFFEGRTVPSL